MKKTLIIVGVVLVIILIWGFASYNSLVSANESINSQWAQVETQYQRRLDLIPNLVSSVKGIMKQEQAIFDNLAAARAHYSGATTVDQKAQAAGDVESALSRLLVVVENYPQLKSSDTVQTLMSQLEGTENRVSVERMRFNDFVKTYNVKIKTFPGSITARLFGFKERAYFQAAAGSDQAPSVNF